MQTLRISSLFEGPCRIDLPENTLSDLGEFTSPLVFRVDGATRQFVGMREFTAAEGEVRLNSRLAKNLGVQVGDSVSIEPVDIPKGTELTLTMTKTSNEVDIKALLESWIPKNYTAVSLGDELVIDHRGEHILKVTGFKPEGEAICVLDTDLDLILTDPCSLDQETSTGEQNSENFVSGDVTEDIVFHCAGLGFVGPEHATSKTSFVAVSADEDVRVPAELLGPRFSALGNGPITIKTSSLMDTAELNPNSAKCEFCGKDVPPQSLLLHTNFCSRNSVKCHCGRKFGQTRQVPESHLEWHALTDHFDTACPACGYGAHSRADLALHSATECASKPILCQFCHLLVPQETTTAVDRAIGLTGHETQCGNRTTECYICKKRVRLRSLETHLKDHDMQRCLQPPPSMCSNRCCPNPDSSCPSSLCTSCFGPLSVPGSNKDEAKLRQRILRRYILQMTRGCGKSWCINEFCAMNKKRTARDAMEDAQRIMSSARHSFCVSEESTQRRMFVDFDEGEYLPGWRALAISNCRSEAEASQWLQANAPLAK